MDNRVLRDENLAYEEGLVPGVDIHQVTQGLRLPPPDTWVVLDVRQPFEWADGVISGALRIPAEQVMDHLEELPTATVIAVVCRSGQRSGTVTAQLQRHGYRAYNVSGGMLAWKGPLVYENQTSPFAERPSCAPAVQDTGKIMMPKMKDSRWMTVVDAQGLSCPMPVVRLSQAVKQVQPGAYIQLVATDAGAEHDIPAWCRQTGHHLVEMHHNATVWTFIVQRSE